MAGSVGPIRATVARLRVTALALAIGLVGCGVSGSPQPIPSGHSSTFAVLEAPRISGDAVPLPIARSLLEGNDPRLSGADIEHARGVLPNQQAWLIPAPKEGELCLVRLVYPLVAKSHGEYLPPSLSRVCSSERAARAGRLFETQSLSTTLAKRLPTRVDGIVPDGIDRVIIQSSGGASKAVRVLRNAYEAIVVNPRSLSFVAQSAGRRRRYVVPTPSAAGGRPYPWLSQRR